LRTFYLCLSKDEYLQHCKWDHVYEKWGSLTFIQQDKQWKIKPKTTSQSIALVLKTTWLHVSQIPQATPKKRSAKTSSALFQLQVFSIHTTTSKIININRNTDKIFLSVNYSEFYRRKYFLGIYWGNYSGKKK
jgi:hypothetical protein